jgi:hypothetical protein
LEPVQGLCVVLLSRLHDGQFDIVESLVIEVNQGEVDCHGLRKSGSALR